MRRPLPPFFGISDDWVTNTNRTNTEITVCFCREKFCPFFVQNIISLSLLHVSSRPQLVAFPATYGAVQNKIANKSDLNFWEFLFFELFYGPIKDPSASSLIFLGE